MKKRLIYLLLTTLVLFLHSCGGSKGSSSEQNNDIISPVASLSDVEQLFNTELLVLENGSDNNLIIKQGGVLVSLEYTGGVPLSTIDLDFTSDTTLQEQLEPIIREFEANIAQIKDNGGSVSLINGNYSNFKGYNSLLFSLSGEIQAEPYMTFIFYEDESELLIFTKNACRALEKAGVTIIFNEDLAETVILMDKECVVEFNDLNTQEGFFIPHSSGMLISSNSNFKIYKYDSSGEDIIWSSIYGSGTPEIEYEYELLGETPELNSIVQLKSRMPWGGDHFDLFGGDKYLRYKGGEATLSYGAGVPTDTTGLSLDDEAALKDELELIIENFEDNIDTIKSNGGSIFLESFDPLGLEGYYSLALGLLERSIFEHIYELNLQYSSNQLIIINKDTCENLERKTLNLISSSATAGSVILINEDCEYTFESYTTSPGNSLDTVQYKNSDVKYAYKYSIVGEEITIGNNLLE